jgi:hypothetical protein
MIPHTYNILASISLTLHFGQHVIFPCPKVAYRKRLPQQQQKKLIQSLNTQIPSIYAYDQNTPIETPIMPGTFAILVV